ncbi:MAG: hypothetical protein JXQ66_05850, partial [Campylobacterales bacterium]|nr:hypothetical protein [Campylobacterales bacterium]
MDNLLVVIPAIKKNAVIADQLVKKLNGITLIQRAIDTAKEITQDIFIITDSQEISLIAERNYIKYHYDNELCINSENIIDVTNSLTLKTKQNNILIYRANAPLVDTSILRDAYEYFFKNKSYILSSVK